MRFIRLQAALALAGLGLVSSHAARADTLTLTDAAGVAYQVNHNIDFATSSSASGAASDASYTAPVAASTAGGGTSMVALSDAFDGFGALAVAVDPMAQGVFRTDNAAQEIYNRTGGAYTLGCDDREMTFPVVASTLVPGLSVSRRVFVPADDTFIRWTEVLSNTGATELSVFVGVSGNLGSDNNTEVYGSSSDDTTASAEDTWVGTMQSFGTGTSSPDPRLGHVMRGTGTPAETLSTVGFTDGDDNPFWWYPVTIPAGQTRLVVHYTTPAPSRAAASMQAAALADLANASSIACFTEEERALVVNFAMACAPTVSCDDGQVCTTDTCEAGVGCVNTMVADCMPCTTAADCNDEDACNGDETCSAAGTCAPGTALDCDDDDSCTTDTCAAATGCANTMIAECRACTTAADCDDDDACNGEETCSETGTCAPGTEPDCDDGDECTADSCDAASGCEHEPITTGACAPDAGIGADAGMGGGSTSGGCGCRAAGSPGAGLGSFGLLMMALALVWVRRRR